MKSQTVVAEPELHHFGGAEINADLAPAPNLMTKTWADFLKCHKF
jgi:hypothetical protein